MALKSQFFAVLDCNSLFWKAQVLEITSTYPTLLAPFGPFIEPGILPKYSNNAFKNLPGVKIALLVLIYHKTKVELVSL